MHGFMSPPRRYEPGAGADCEHSRCWPDDLDATRSAGHWIATRQSLNEPPTTPGCRRDYGTAGYLPLIRAGAVGQADISQAGGGAAADRQAVRDHHPAGAGPERQPHPGRDGGPGAGEDRQAAELPADPGGHRHGDHRPEREHRSVRRLRGVRDQAARHPPEEAGRGAGVQDQREEGRTPRRCTTRAPSRSPTCARRSRHGWTRLGRWQQKPTSRCSRTNAS